jgi:hypothetical protein
MAALRDGYFRPDRHGLQSRDDECCNDTSAVSGHPDTHAAKVDHSFGAFRDIIRHQPHTNRDLRGGVPTGERL